MNDRQIRGFGVAAVALAIWFSPVPEGLELKTWHLFSIFAATIFGFVLQPLPIGALSVISLAVAGLTGVLTTADLLSGFASSTVWLIVSAILYAAGFIQTGLGQRISYIFLQRLGDSPLKLTYAIVLSDLLMSPATPSNTARAGGILFPVVLSVAENCDSRPGPTARRIGSYLMITMVHANCITSSMFLTATGANPLVAMLAATTLGTEISWGLWALAASVPGVVSLIAIPYCIYRLYPPQLTKTPEVQIGAAKALAAMGPMSPKEKKVAGIFLLSFVLWSTSGFSLLDTTVVAILGVGLMLVTRVITWSDALNQQGAWDILIWLGATISLADGLNTQGFFTFATGKMSLLSGISWEGAFFILLLVFVYGHYAFAGNTPHVVAMYTAVCSIAIAAGAPRMMTVLAFAFMSNISSGIMHYCNGPAAIYFGAGYVGQGTWMRLGALITFINMVIWVGLGSIWWKVLGLW